MSWDKMKDDYAKLYAELLSPEERKSSSSSTKAPPDRRTLDKQPTIIEKIDARCNKKSWQECMPRIQEAIKAEVQNTLSQPPQKAE